MSKKIITIQHTQSEQHINGIIGPWENWDFTDLGIEHANRIGQKPSMEIQNEKYVLYASDLQRTKHTAKIISGYLKIEPIYSELLREFNLGEDIGKTKEWARNNTKCPR